MSVEGCSGTVSSCTFVADTEKPQCLLVTLGSFIHIFKIIAINTTGEINITALFNKFILINSDTITLDE
jgi:hypothetical protein